MTKQQVYAQQLLDMGFEEDLNPRTRKYRVFTRPELSRNIYLGKAGAVRYGNNIADSLSMDPKRLMVALQNKFLARRCFYGTESNSH